MVVQPFNLTQFMSSTISSDVKLNLAGESSHPYADLRALRECRQVTPDSVTELELSKDQLHNLMSINVFLSEMIVPIPWRSNSSARLSMIRLSQHRLTTRIRTQSLNTIYSNIRLGVRSLVPGVKNTSQSLPIIVVIRIPFIGYLK